MQDSLKVYSDPKQLLSKSLVWCTVVTDAVGEGGGGVLPYKGDRDARSLA